MLFFRSFLLKFNPTEGFVVHQQLLTKAAISVTSFHTTTDSYLVITNEQNNFGDTDQSIDVYSWNSALKKFVLIQKIPSVHVLHVHMFYLEDTTRCMNSLIMQCHHFESHKSTAVCLHFQIVHCFIWKLSTVSKMQKR